MHSVAIRDLKNNPSNMTKYLENSESVFITKHGKPIGVTIPLGDDTLSMGIKKLLVLQQYEKGLISLGKAAELLDMTKQQMLSLVDTLGIDWMDITEEELQEELKVAKKVAK